jgi:hypothetical protein
MSISECHKQKKLVHSVNQHFFPTNHNNFLRQVESRTSASKLAGERGEGLAAASPKIGRGRRGRQQPRRTNRRQKSGFLVDHFVYHSEECYVQIVFVMNRGFLFSM